MKKIILLILILCFTPIAAFSKISVVEPVPDLMNDTDGFLTFCAPTDFQENIARTEGFNFNSEKLQQIFSGSKIWDIFSKDTSTKPGYASKFAFKNLNRFALKKGYQSVPTCSFVNGKYVSGGLKVDLIGHKTNTTTTDSSYIFLEKNHNANYQRLPLQENPFSLSRYANFSTVEKLNLFYRYLSGDETSTGFYDKYNLEKARIFNKEVFSFALQLPARNRWFQNNFLQLKITDGRTKRTAIKLNYNIAVVPTGAIKLSQKTYCTDLLHLSGFCNRELASSDKLANLSIQDYGLATSSGYKSFYEGIHSGTFNWNSIVQPNDTNVEDFHLSTSDISNYGIGLVFNTVKLEKTGGASSTAKVLITGRLVDHPDVLVFGEFNFNKGNDLPDLNSPNFDAQGLESNLNFSTITQSEINNALMNIYVANPVVSGGSAYGVAPTITWDTAPDQDYYRGSDAGGYRVYRNDVLIAELATGTSSYQDNDLYGNVDLPTGYYRYAVVAVNAKGEYYYPEENLDCCNQRPFQTELIQKYAASGEDI